MSCRTEVIFNGNEPEFNFLKQLFMGNLNTKEH